MARGDLHQSASSLPPFARGGRGGGVTIFAEHRLHAQPTIELEPLYLRRGADPVEPDAEPWATPLA